MKKEAAYQALQAEFEQIKRESARFWSYVDDNPSLMVRFPGEGTVTFVNRTFSRFVGMEKEEIFGKNLLSLVVSSDRETVLKMLGDLHPEISSVSALFRITAEGGDKRWIQWMVSPILDGDNIFIEYQAVGLDVTDQKLIEEELFIRNTYFKKLFDCSPEGIVILDDQDKVIEANKGFETLFLYTLEEARGKHINDLIAPEGMEAEASALSSEVLRGETIRKVSIRRRKDGTVFPVSILGTPITFEERRSAVYGIYRDMTGEREAEEKIRASLREKEVLLKEIYHRVKNNLQVISSLLNLQASNLENEDIRKHFRDSQNRIQSMALVHECLYLSSSLAQIDLSEYIEKLVSIIFDSYSGSSPLPELTLELETIQITLDHAVPCGLIINELLTNALKYAFPEHHPDSSGKSRITVSLNRSGSGDIVLEIKDNGAGMPEDRLQWGANSLGLKLIYSLADQIGGAVDFISAAGSGTSCIVTFSL